MKTTRIRAVSLLAALAVLGAPALADERTEYYRRAAARDLALFQSLDRNADGVLERGEAAGDLTLGPRFDDVDINRDGRITQDELRGYIGRRYGVEVAPPPAAPQR